MSTALKTEVEGKIATITFNRPEKMNALTSDMYDEFDNYVQGLPDNDDVGALIITGTGRGFCAGADVSEFQAIEDPDERWERFRQGRSVLRLRRSLQNILSLRDIELPTIAAVNGFAIGRGWLCALACDFRIATDDAVFFMPEIDMGSHAPLSILEWITSEVGRSRAKEIFLTGRRFTAQELFHWGLVNRVVASDELMPAARELAETLAAKARDILLRDKAGINGFDLTR